MSNPDQNHQPNLAPQTNHDSKTLSQRVADLDAAVEWFYSDDFALDQATDNYKSALAMAKSIEEDLKNLQNEIEVLAEDFSK